MTELPALDRIFFPYGTGDGDEHPEGSCCRSLDRAFFPTAAATWSAVRDQHLIALSVLVDQAEQEGGWALARPLIFSAHHVSELALKTVTLQRDDKSQSDNLLAGTTWSNCSGKTVNGMGVERLSGR